MLHVRLHLKHLFPNTNHDGQSTKPIFQFCRGETTATVRLSDVGFRDSAKHENVLSTLNCVGRSDRHDRQRKTGSWKLRERSSKIGKARALKRRRRDGCGKKAALKHSTCTLSHLKCMPVDGATDAWRAFILIYSLEGEVVLTHVKESFYAGYAK